MTRRGLAIKTLILAAGVAFTLAFWINWCELIYQCGCTFYWAGAAAHCNIHQGGVRHCPWCTNPVYGGVALGVTLVCQLVAAFWPGVQYWRNLSLTIIASPAAAAVAGVAIGFWAGYWFGTPEPRP